MNVPRLPFRQLYISREGTVHRNTDIIALSVGPCRKTTSSKQRSETQILSRWFLWSIFQGCMLTQLTVEGWCWNLHLPDNIWYYMCDTWAVMAFFTLELLYIGKKKDPGIAHQWTHIYLNHNYFRNLLININLIGFLLSCLNIYSEKCINYCWRDL